MTKRLSKSLAVLFLSMVMVFAAVIPAFAESSSITYVEDHSVVDCVHRYKNNDGTFTFTIKLPKGRNQHEKGGILADRDRSAGFLSHVH